MAFAPLLEIELHMGHLKTNGAQLQIIAIQAQDDPH